MSKQFLDVLRDGNFLLTVAGIAVAAVGGIVGLLKDSKPIKGLTLCLFALIIIGAIIGIWADLLARRQSNNDKERASRSQQQLLTDNADLKRQNEYLKQRADDTYAAAVALNEQSRRILNDTGETLGTTRSISQQTMGLVGQAKSLQQSAAMSLRGIHRLSTPIANVYATYEVNIPLNDPRLANLKKAVLVSPDVKSGVLPLYNILQALPSNDTGAGFLRAMDLEIEMYQPPFPPQPLYGDEQHGSKSPAGTPDFFLATHRVRRLSQSLASETPGSAFGLPYSIQLDGTSQTGLTNPKHAIVSAYAVPMDRGARSGRLDSLTDLSGSKLLIHLGSGLPSLEAYDILKHVILEGVVVSVDGSWFRLDLSRAQYHSGPMFAYYEIDVPKDWVPDSHTIP